MKKTWTDIIFSKKGNTLTLEELKSMYYLRCLNRLQRLFKYTNLPFPQHELEFRAIISGFAGVAEDKIRGIMTAWGGMSGVTQYSDIFKRFTFAAPTAKGGSKIIGESAVILRNTPMMDSYHYWLLRYADLYAHNDISLRMALINSRYQDILKSTDSSKEETIKNWYKGLYNGELLAIIDDSPLSEFLDGKGAIEALQLNHTGEIDFTRFTELENELTRTFYRDIGIRWNKDKKANLVSGEVEQDNMLLEFNISDMLDSRKEFCNDYNRVMKGRKGWIGEISVELRVPLEREVETYDNANDSRLSGQDTE